jgi:hypothetical protein
MPVFGGMAATTVRMKIRIGTALNAAFFSDRLA